MAFAAFKDDKTLAELPTQFVVHPTQVPEWKPHVPARFVDVFGSKKSMSDAPALKVLHARIEQPARHWRMIVEKGRSSRRMAKT